MVRPETYFLKWATRRRRRCGVDLRAPGYGLAAALGLALAAPGLSGVGKQENQSAGTPPTFETVRPVLEAHCIKCHGDGLRYAKLDLRDREAMITGGRSGPALVPGNPDRSLLFTQVATGKMPLEGEPPLSETQVELIREWIAGGARTGVHPAAIAASGPGVSYGVSKADRNFWSFRTPLRPSIPEVQHNNRARTPVDAFILKKLEAEGLTLSKDADRRTLIRRAFFDLIGLPPTPDEVDSFVADEKPDAYERLLDRLLASERYGERWGRHWLDAVGYADSDGHWDSDNPRKSAYRYRDYVIRSFNVDKPYDEFLLEQVAGDEMVNLSGEQLEPETIARLEATGYLRTGADPTYEDYDLREYRYTAIDNTIRNFGSSALGLTMHCAKCHDHKFDPIPQRDYYRLEAILKPAYDPDNWIVSEKRGFAEAPLAERERARIHNEPLDKKITSLKETREQQRFAYEDQILAKKLLRFPEALRRDLKAAIRTELEERSDVQRYLAGKFEEELKIEEDELNKAFPEFKDKDTEIEKTIKAVEAKRLVFPHIRGLADMGSTVPDTFLRVRGEYDNFGEKVEPGPLAVLSDPRRPFQVPDLGDGAQTAGLRTALARWLVHPDHPLTARVMVNRIWHYHFGNGLVRTPDNFGKKGERPTHPELLDWLATEFVRGGWSTKAMHKLIMTSTVYRQGSLSSELGARVDGENRLWWRMPLRRADAEAIRDSMLAVAGTLNFEMYGPPVPVQIDKEGEVITAAEPSAWRRSIYLQQRRSRMLTLLQLYDAPVMEFTCPRRSRSTLSTQALHVRNSDFTILQAKYFARRILDEKPKVKNDARVDYAFRLVFGRPASDKEQRMSRGFLERQVDSHERVLAEPQSEPVESTTSVASHADTLDALPADGEGKEAPEPPPVPEPEAEPQSPAEFLAWSDLCHMLLCANEFVYID